MAKNQSTYTLQIDAELGNLKTTLDSAKKALAQLMQSGNAPKGLEKSFEKIDALLGQISDKSGRALDLKGLSGTGKDLETIQDNFKAIVRLLGQFDDLSDDVKLSFISQEDQQNIRRAEAALKAYGDAAVEASKKMKILEAAKKNLNKDSGNLSKAKKNVSGLEDEKKKKEAKLTGAQGKLDAVKGMENANPKQVAEYEAAVTSLKAELEVLEKNLKEANDELNAAQLTYDNSAKGVKKLEGEIKKITGSSLKDLKKEATELGVSMEGLNGRDAASQVEILTERLEELKKEALAGAEPAFNAIVEGCSNAGKATDDLGNHIKDATEDVKKMDEAASQREAFEGKIKSFLGFAGAAQVMRAALRDAIQTITELDEVMGQMAVVTDLSVGDYWEQLPEYSERASELGVSITEAYEAATLYYQQGLKTNEVTALSEQTLKMAAIAGLEAADATDRMTAALRGFNMELSETNAQKIADVYSELAAITASDVDEISTAMTKTASIASSAGMEFETTAAFLSQIIETTRESAETAGTAMKTVIARFQELKKDPSEIGEVDGEIVDANAIETALRSVGVSLRDASGQFRDLDDVFMELSGKWNSLDKNTQRYIATIAAGSRQQSRFIAMMSNYARTQELVTAANNSAGASQKQFEKTTETLEYKVNQLKNAWHEFTMGIMNSSFVKFGVDVLTKFLEVINKVTEGFGSFTGSISKIGGIIAIFKIGKSLFEKIKAPITKLFSDIVQGSQQAGADATRAFQKGALEAKQGTPQQGGQPAPMGKSAAVQNLNQQRAENKWTVQPNTQGKIAAPEGAGVMSRAGIGVMNATGASSITAGVQKLGDAKRAKQALKVGYGNTNRDELLKKKEEADNKVKQAQEEKGRGRGSRKGGMSKAQEENLKKLQEEQKKANAELEEYDELTKKVEDDSKAGWDSITNGMEQASQALVAGGVAVGMLGQAFVDAGAEGFGEGLQKVGSVMTLLGSILGIVIPIINLLKPAFAGAGTAGVSSGTASTAAWGVVGLIVMIVMAAILVTLLIILAVIALVNHNPAGKALEEATAAAEAASEAADRAAESYNNLANALDELDGKYKALEDLTEGTEEWNKAVQEINDSVLDLIAEYPELAQFVKQEGGVLKLDTESDDVQNVLKNAKATAVAARNAEISAKLDVNNAQAAYNYNELDDTVGAYTKEEAAKVNKYKMSVDSQTGISYLPQEEQQEALELMRNSKESARSNTDNMAKALASGDIRTVDGKVTTDLTDAELQEKYGFDSSSMEYFYDQIDENVDALSSFGDQLIKNEQQAKASYEAMATAAEEMANLSHLTLEQQQQAKNVTDGDTYATIEGQVNEELSSLNMDAKDGEGGDRNSGFYDNMTSEELEAFNQSLETVYGKGASYNRKSGQVTYTDADGNLQTEELNERDEQVKKQMASIIATNRHAAATEAAPIAIEALNAAVRESGIEGAEDSEAFSNMFDSSDGMGLTKEDLKYIRGVDDEGKDDGELSEADIQAYWDAMGPEGQKAFAGGIEEFSEKITHAVNTAAGELENEDGLSYMTAGLTKAFSAKLDEVRSTPSGEAGADAIKGLVENLQYEIDAEGNQQEVLSDKMMQEIQAKINNTDWSNLDELTKLQYQLQQEYGISEEEAKNLVTTMGDASYAISNFGLTVEKFGMLFQANQALARSTETLTRIQWEYNQALQAGGKEATAAMDEMMAKYNQQIQLYSVQATEGRENLSKVYAQGIGQKGIETYGIDLSTITTLNEDGTVSYDSAEITGLLNSGMLKEEAWEEWLDSMEEQRQVLVESEQGIRDTIDAVQEMDASLQESYDSLFSQAFEAYASKLQESIDVESDILAAEQDASAAIVDKIQDQINDQRQARENEKAEKSLTDKRSQMAYLAMDTSGSNQLQQLQLDEQLKQEEQSYQDSLVDQSIQQMQDANAKAEEQRSRQIEIAQQQLDTHLQSAEAQMAVESMMASSLAQEDFLNSQMGQLLMEQQTKGMTTEQIAEWQANVNAEAAEAKMWREGQAARDAVISNANDSLNIMAALATGDSVALAQEAATIYENLPVLTASFGTLTLEQIDQLAAGQAVSITNAQGIESTLTLENGKLAQSVNGELVDVSESDQTAFKEAMTNNGNAIIGDAVLTREEIASLVAGESIQKDLENGMSATFSIGEDGQLNVVGQDGQKIQYSDEDQATFKTAMNNINTPGNIFTMAVAGKAISLTGDEYKNLITSGMFEKDGKKFTLDSNGGLTITNPDGTEIELGEEFSKAFGAFGSGSSLASLMGGLPTNISSLATDIRGAGKSTLDDVKTAIGNIDFSLDMSELATEMANENSKQNLRKVGFNEASLKGKTSQELANMEAYVKAANVDNENANIKKLNAAGIDYNSKENYYNDSVKLAEIASKGANASSYEKYLSGKVSTAKTNIEEELTKQVGSYHSFEKFLANGTNAAQLEKYKALGGSVDTLKKTLSQKIVTGHGGVWATGVGDSWDNWDSVNIIVDDKKVGTAVYGHDRVVDSSTKTKIEKMVGTSPEDGWMAMINSVPYLYDGDHGGWHYFDNNDKSGTADEYSNLVTKYLERLRKYESGGIADFTGPAWLDGTPSKPEYILNAEQTERFFSLVDILGSLDMEGSNSKSGDNYFDIAINVEKLENDYDVEKVAEKIRKMIYEDASYRNVNAINLIR